MGAPSGWETPKTDWATDDAPTQVDFNRIENNINRIETSARTISPSAPADASATLREYLDEIAYQVKAITGETNWYDTPSFSLQDLAILHFSGA